MTDTNDPRNQEQSDEYRRKSDTRIDSLLDLTRSHMEEYHANLEPGEAMEYVRKIDEMYATNARVLTILDGKKVLNASGETERVGGMSKDMAEMKLAMNGGGLSMTTRDKLLIIGVNGTFALGVAWIATVV